MNFYIWVGELGGMGRGFRVSELGIWGAESAGIGDFLVAWRWFFGKYLLNI
jgi:hypothetical protein